MAEAAPFLLSCAHGPAHRWVRAEEYAEACVALRRPGKEALERYLPCLSVGPRGAVPPEFCPAGRPGDAFRVAACMLAGHGSDERVFLAFLAHFAAALPYAKEGIRKRLKDPRVIPGLQRELQLEERRSPWEDGRRHYSDEYGAIAKLLARLGDTSGKDALVEYKRYLAWQRRQPM